MAERPDPDRRRAAAYWLALAFHCPNLKRPERNALVLKGHREFGLGLLDLVRMGPSALPEPLRPHADILARFLDEQGRVSAQAFVVERLFEAGIDVLPITDPRYPAHLAKRLRPAYAPTVLLVAGDPMLLRDPGVAVSGSRDAGPIGLRFARAAGAALARAGVPLISGLARGVDEQAFEGALDFGGRVVGVAAEGILNVRALRHGAVAAGRMVVVSEFAPTQRWMAGLAMARNATIGGLSRALIVADCVKTGGTTEQVRKHRELGMPVFVRRGSGEGALVREIAAWQGVATVSWEDGPVRIPGVIDGAERVECDVRRSDAGIEIRVVAAPGTSDEDIIDTVRGALSAARGPALREPAGQVSEPAPNDAAAAPAPPPADVPSREAAPASRATTAPDAQVGPEAGLQAGLEAGPGPGRVIDDTATTDPIVDALRRASGAGMTLQELVAATGGTEHRVRSRVKSLVEAGQADESRRSRSKVYRLRCATAGPATVPAIGAGDVASAGDAGASHRPPPAADLPLFVRGG